MKIGIVTIYESITNLGSFLQAYALKTALESLGHDVYLIQNVSTLKTACKAVFKINPKREMFLRVKKAYKFISDVKKVKLMPRGEINTSDLDVLIYGSDEIWNMDNPYFKDDLFWGTDSNKIDKIAYAVSIGAMSEETISQNIQYTKELVNYKNILVRDDRTWEFVKKITGEEPDYVCDPTILVPLESITKSIKLPKEKYMLVYTYGLDEPMIQNVVRYAREHNLKIISPCFWHIWADEIIECSALQFSSLIAGAECVFTSTFHGAIFTLLNHKHCCILPVREKVTDIARRLGEDNHIIPYDCDYDRFSSTMEIEFDDNEFEKRVKEWREKSFKLLKESLECLEK